MNKILSENLFLLEFLVDKVVLIPGTIPKEIADVTGETCVSFKFLDNDPLDICEADFTPIRDYSQDATGTKSGKSCLFAVSEEEAQKARKIFDVCVSVYKKLSNGVLPDKLQIGTATVSIACIFNEIIEALLNKCPDDGPAAGDTLGRTLKDCFPIINNNRDEIGKLAVFVRMSCFGKVIVTQFQMNLEEKSVFFKDKEGKSLYKYRKVSKSESRPMSDYTTASQGAYPTAPHLRPAAFDNWNPPNTMDGQNVSQPFPNMGTPCNLCAIQPYGNPVTPYVPPQKENPRACYQEVGAEMNGNSLTIRVHKDKHTSIKRLDKDGNESEAGCVCARQYGGSQQYVGEPQYIGGQQYGGQQYGGGQRYDNGYNQSFSGGGPQYPGSEQQCTCSEKQILSLKPGDDPNNPFTFKMSGCPNATRQNITVVPPTSNRSDGMQVTEISDPSKDVFVLRIGKKSEGTDKKANLELELITPKGIEKKPIPKKESRETQYAADDAKKKSKKGKGKKGKGKGKGKASPAQKTAALREEQAELEKAAGITRGPDGKLILPPNSPPARGPDGRIIPGGAVVKGPDGKILRIISASGIVRGPDGKIISFSTPPKIPSSKSPMVLVSRSDIPCIPCCARVSRCTTTMKSCTSLAYSSCA